jgi:HAE1 family hydrophobic/amphiphilic exporter-1
VDGLTTAVYREGGQEYDIRVKMKDSALKDIEDIRNIPIASKNGIFPLSRYADVSFEEGYNQIMRSDKTRTVELTADLLPGYAQGPVQAEVIKAIGTIEFPAGYKIGRSAMMKMMEDSSAGMIVVFITAILLVYMLLAAILENLVQPLFIITTIPLSLIGVAVACFITNTVINSIAMISIVMLIGIVVNNAILLLDHANQLKREGCGAVPALIEAGQKKLKAILMSNIAIILGMVPMALGIGASMAELRKPMGIIVIGGIISSTVLTLWLIPALDLTFSGGSKGTNK